MLKVVNKLNDHVQFSVVFYKFTHLAVEQWWVVINVSNLNSE